MVNEQLAYGYMIKEENYPDKATIIEEGSKGDWIYIILKGVVKVKKKTPKGMMTVDTLKQGAVFGEMVLFGKELTSRTASVVADGSVTVGLLDTDLLFRDFEAITPQLRGLIKTMFRRLDQTTTRVVEMATESM
jgi:CRP-like cAMP-binding protein